MYGCKHVGCFSINTIFEIYNGLALPAFYHPCQLCNDTGGLYHTLFECGKAQEIVIKSNITKYPIKKIIGYEIPTKELIEINKTLNLLIFTIRQYYILKKHTNQCNINNDQINFIIIKFFQENYQK